jgi:hypothetical protein
MLHRFLSRENMCIDSFGSTSAPEVVIRQIGDSEMQVWDLKEKRVSVFDGNSRGLLSCFDPQKSLYLYEPGSSLNGPHYEGLSIPTVCSVSPDIRRFKEFAKNGAVKLYMPTWTLSELLAVRRFASDRHPQEILLTEEDIKQRFSEFGGIFRHVFSSDVETIRRQQDEAVALLDPKKFLLDNIDREHMSHLIAQFKVNTNGPRAFREPHIDLVSSEMQRKVERRFLSVDLHDKISLLMKNDEIPTTMSSHAPVIYEEVIASRLVQGMSWKRKDVREKDFSQFNVKLQKLSQGRPPIFTNMEAGVLYKSLKENFAAVDMMFKTEDGFLVGIQVTRLHESVRKIKANSVDIWLDSLGIGRIDRSHVRIAVVPRPKASSKFRAIYDLPCVGFPDIEIWGVPSDYSRSEEFSRETEPSSFWKKKQ